jgi:NAD(P)-dependent dehydrogenase (short-subunit alcohol dehydrogenase family)
MPRGSFDLAGRNVLVTGAAQGLGAAMSIALAEQGASIAVLDKAPRSDSAPNAVIEGLGCKSKYIEGDVTNLADCQNAVDEVVDDWGGLDILVNNAGIAVNGPAESISLTDVQHVFDIDLFGMLTCCQAAFPALKASSHASVVNIASIAGISVLRPQKHVGYNTAKAAVISLTRTLAVEWAETGIRVNAIAPGYMTSPAVELLRAQSPENWAAWMARVPMGRAGDPSELGGAAVFLASDASSYVTGSVLVVDGGYTSL